MNGDVIVPIFLFGGAAAVLWKYFEGRHKERLAMIERGMNPGDLKTSAPRQLRKGSVLGNLKWGLLFVFAGVGLLVGQQLHYYFGFQEEVAGFAGVFIAGGLALIVFYLIASKKLTEKNEDVV